MSSNNTTPMNLGELLNISNDVKIFTCDDFKGNIEITVENSMYLFYARKIKNSTSVLTETPIDVFDMETETPTPGSNNYIRLGGSSVNEKIHQLLEHCN
jgi:hypothetical protein